MAKVIKFNLSLDGERCRSVEDIQDNFNISDILELFKDERLTKWLKNRKLSDHLEKVSNISQDSSDKDIAAALCDIFCIPCSKSDIEDALLIGQISSDIKDGSDFEQIARDYKDRILSSSNKTSPAPQAALPPKSNGSYLTEEQIGLVVTSCSPKVQRKLAQDETTDPNILEYLLSDHKREEVVYFISCNPSINKSTFDTLLSKNKFFIDIELVRNKSTSIDKAMKLYDQIKNKIGSKGYNHSTFHDEPWGSRSYFSSFNSLNDKEDKPSCLYILNTCLIEHPDVSGKTISDIYSQYNLDSYYDRLVSYEIISSIASNPNTPIETLEEIIKKDEHEHYIYDILKNPITPKSIINKAFEEEKEEIEKYGVSTSSNWFVLLDNPKLPIDMIDYIATNCDNRNILIKVTENPNTPDAVLRKLMTSKESDVVTAASLAFSKRTEVA